MTNLHGNNDKIIIMIIMLKYSERVWITVMVNVKRQIRVENFLKQKLK